MVKIVTDGAIMCCTLGTWQAKLTVLSQSFRSISGRTFNIELQSQVLV